MFVYFAKAYLFGLRECINPYSLALLLYFLFYLSTLGTSYKKFLIQGLSFLVLIGVSSAFLQSGALDMFILRKDLQKYFHIFYFIVGIFYIVNAGMHFYDWIKIRIKEKSPQEARVTFPPFLCFPVESSRQDLNYFEKMRYGLTAIFLQMIAFGFVVSQIIWPAGMNLYRLYLVFLGEGHQRFAYAFFGFYAFGFVFLQILFLLTVLYLAKKKQGKDLSLTEKSLYKIIVSSLYAAVGAGMIYYFVVEFLLH